MSGRPLDVLEAALEDVVTVTLKDGTAYYGTLAGYDQHMNAVLEPATDVEDETDTVRERVRNNLSGLALPYGVAEAVQRLVLEDPHVVEAVALTAL